MFLAAAQWKKLQRILLVLIQPLMSVKERGRLKAQRRSYCKKSQDLKLSTRPFDQSWQPSSKRLRERSPEEFILNFGWSTRTSTEGISFIILCPLQLFLKISAVNLLKRKTVSAQYWQQNFFRRQGRNRLVWLLRLTPTDSSSIKSWPFGEVTYRMCGGSKFKKIETSVLNPF